MKWNVTNLLCKKYQTANKKMGFVVDLNISRVLQTCINYTVYKNSKSVEDKIKYTN